MAQYPFGAKIQREMLLRAGHKETVVAGFYVLYWEPYTDNNEFKHAFTIDALYENGVPGKRWRFETLESADQKIEQLKIKHATDIARRAFGLA